MPLPWEVCRRCGNHVPPEREDEVGVFWDYFDKLEEYPGYVDGPVYKVRCKRCGHVFYSGHPLDLEPFMRDLHDLQRADLEVSG